MLNDWQHKIRLPSYQGSTGIEEVATTPHMSAINRNCCDEQLISVLESLRKSRDKNVFEYMGIILFTMFVLFYLAAIGVMLYKVFLLVLR